MWINLLFDVIFVTNVDFFFTFHLKPNFDIQYIYLKPYIIIPTYDPISTYHCTSNLSVHMFTMDNQAYFFFNLSQTFILLERIG